MSQQPYRTVTFPELIEVDSARDDGSKRRTWRLTLDCGHVVIRPVRYDKAARNGNRGRGRPREDVQPAQPKVQCRQCPPLPETAHLDTSVTIVTSPRSGRRLIDLMSTAGRVDHVEERPRVGGLVLFKVRFTLNPEGALHGVG